MTNAVAEKPSAKIQRKNAISQIATLGEQTDDLNDYLDLLEARARNKGKRTYTLDETRRRLGLA